MFMMWTRVVRWLWKIDSCSNGITQQTLKNKPLFLTGCSLTKIALSILFGHVLWGPGPPPSPGPGSHLPPFVAPVHGPVHTQCHRRPSITHERLCLTTLRRQTAHTLKHCSLSEGKKANGWTRLFFPLDNLGMNLLSILVRFRCSPVQAKGGVSGGSDTGLQWRCGDGLAGLQGRGLLGVDLHPWGLASRQFLWRAVWGGRGWLDRELRELVAVGKGLEHGVLPLQDRIPLVQFLDLLFQHLNLLPHSIH